ncbi:MAG TPA: ABC transporter ATP-binding protein [Coriobacteriia bacterium]|jgi:ABC-2 type transport system ATP-binding protein
MADALLPALWLRGLTKTYGGVNVLDGVDLTVAEGSVFGFLGPNGAGKTTTLRIITGLAKPTSGTARILGIDVSESAEDVRSAVGFLPDVPGFYPWMTAEEFLRFAGGLFALPRDVLDERVPVLLDLAGLAGVSTRIGGFSRGMKQRLGIAQALVNAPRLLLLDEPTSALDPIGRKDVLEMVASLAGRTTVFFSTHILADVERVCDTVAVLDRGRVAASGPIDEIKSRHGAQVMDVEVDAGAQGLAERLTGEGWLTSAELDGERLRLTVSDLAAAERAVPAAVAALGLRLVRLDAGEVSLEEAFVELVGGAR